MRAALVRLPQDRLVVVWRDSRTHGIFWKRRNTMVQFVKKFWKEEEGVTAIEYGLIAALIAVVIIVAVTAVGANLNKVFTYIASELGKAPAAGN